MSFGFENVKPIHARGTDAAEVIEVIRTKAMRGAGIEEDPVREVTQYLSLIHISEPTRPY